MNLIDYEFNSMKILFNLGIWIQIQLACNVIRMDTLLLIYKILYISENI